MNENIIWDILYGFFVGFVVFYALKKVIKFLIVVLGLYILSLLFLDYQGIVSVDKKSLDLLFEKLFEVIDALFLYSQNEVLFFIGVFMGLFFSLKTR